ncbi:MAG: hypothetical protein IRZ33_05990 [Alicyclobacillaceae bacterium]|nr:hypothetical protein [Alicyclobacillaceae bacterium]
MPKYKITFVSETFEEYEVEASSREEAVNMVCDGKIEPVNVWERSDITEVKEI